MSTDRGFTLIEVVMTAGILLCGLVAVASVFSFVVRTNGINRQMAVATTLLYDKMEQFRSAPFTHPVWNNSTGSETLSVAGERYIRSWKIEPGIPRTVTIIIYAQNQALSRRQSELIRATTLVSPTF